MDKQRTAPPSWSTKFLAWFIKPEYYEDIQGDLEEEYHQLLATKGLTKAKKWYNWQIIRLFRPEMTRKIEAQNSIEKETTMFKNYFKIGLRNLWKYKSSTIINVIGLSTGLAAFILIALFVKDELSYDRHHLNAENIYRVTVKNYTPQGDISRHWAFASAGHAERLKADYAEITHATRFFPWAFPDIRVGEKKFTNELVIFADNDVFDIFTFPFIEGNPENAFDDVFSLVLTESSAIKLFGNDWQEQQIIGKQVTLTAQGQDVPFKISGVMKDMPPQQHFHFDYLAPLRLLEKFMGEEALNYVGGNYNWLTYIRTTPGANIQALEQSANEEFWDKYIGSFSTGENARDFYDFHFQPLLDIHLKSNLEGEYERNGSLQLVYVFAAIGILLLLVACVNYMNIATSHYSRRMKEVGVRKVIGAHKSALIKQFLSESFLVVVVAMPLAILLVSWALPYMNHFIYKEMVFNPLEQKDLTLGLLGLMILVGVLAGIYPALFLSKINLVQALKGEQSVNAKKWNFRAILVGFQYIVTIGLIFSILVIEGQMQFIRKTDPGYERDQVLYLNLPREANLESFKNELLSHPNIVRASYSSRIPTGRLMDSWGARFFKGDSAVTTDFRLPYVRVDRDFLDTYGIELVAGDNFSEGMKTALIPDSTSTGYYIVNETAARALGFENPADVVGQRLGYGPSQGHIIGVMADFHFESLHNEIVPMMIVYSDQYRGMSLKIKENDIPKTLAYIEDTFAKFDQETSPNYTFVDDLFERQYIREQKTGQAIKVFAGIAILISCLGLIGMVGFIIETKVKEIGVRKVLGASSGSIWMVISNRFIVLMALAFAITLPVSYWLMSGWLENFVYRTNISLLMIIAPFFVVAFLTLLAISYQTVKATRINPVECLKDE